MNKKQKSSIILASLATIAVSGSLIAGATYALFTSESTTNIAVTSGKVDVTATISEFTTYTGKDLTGVVKDDDEKIKPSTDYGLTNGQFKNGGTASLSDGTLTLDKVTPGDKVTFTIKVKNESNVAIKYRTVVSCESNTGLFDGLEFTIGSTKFTGGLTSKSTWKELEANGKISSESEDGTLSVACSVNLPSSASNDYQNKSCTVSYTVEAVQGNAKTEDLAANTYELYNASDLKWFQKNAKNVRKVDGTLATVKLMKDIDLGNEEWTPINWNYNADGEGGTFDGNGHTISNFKVFKNSEEFDSQGSFAKNLGLFGKVINKTIKNLTVKGATVSGVGRVGAILGQGECVYIENCHVYDSTITSTVWRTPEEKYDDGDKAGAIVGQLSAESSAHVSKSSATNCTIKGYRDIGGLVGYFGCYASSTNETAYVTHNSVKKITIINDQSQNYKSYTGDKFDVGKVVGEQYIPDGCTTAPSLVDNNTIAEDVTITVEQ